MVDSLSLSFHSLSLKSLSSAVRQTGAGPQGLAGGGQYMETNSISASLHSSPICKYGHRLMLGNGNLNLYTRLHTMKNPTGALWKSTYAGAVGVPSEQGRPPQAFPPSLRSQSNI